VAIVPGAGSRFHFNLPQRIAAGMLLLFLAQGLWLTSRQTLSDRDYQYARCGREMWERPAAHPNSQNTVAPLNFLDWRDQNSVFESMGASENHNLTISGSGEPARVRAQRVTAGYFEMLGVTPQAGRTFTTAEERERVVLISHGLARRRFGGSGAAVGAGMTLDGQIHTVLGVLPPGPSVFGECEIWWPFSTDRAAAVRNSHSMRVVGRLKAGVSIEQANADMAVIAERIAQSSPETNKGWGIGLATLQQGLTGSDLK
jgi:putative ABC transport system permease protein